MKKLLLLGITCLLLLSARSQTNAVSSSPDPYCIGFTYTANAGGTGAHSLEPSNNYGCLISTPNPSWFFLKAATAGDVELNLYAANDIDFILYGPFVDMNDMLSWSGQLGVVPQAPELDCSYSGTNNEYITIPSMNAGEYFLLLVTNYASITQDITIEQIGGTGSLDCSVFSQPFQHIGGTAFYDLNQNGIQDTDEYTLPNVTVDFAPMNTSVITNLSGTFNFNYFTQDTIDYIVSANLPGWSNTTLNPTSFTLDTINYDTTGLAFGFFPDSVYYSSTIDQIGTSAICVGTNINWVAVQNNGTLVSAGIVELLLDSELTYLSSSYPADSVVGNSVFFSYDSLQPFQGFTIQVLAEPAITLAVSDTIVNVATLTLLDSLLTAQSTLVDTLSLQTICSYDPNQKVSFPNGYLSTDHLITPSDKLEYVIHFQNTGSAAAVNVKIEDALSPLLDESTFEFMSSSHLTYASIDSTRKLTFDFPDINLPDSLSNEPMSHGYVKFRIALSPAVQPNEVVTNTASIFFDNNAPVITNTDTNTLTCFILPLPINLTYASGVINSNVTDPNCSFEWYLDGVLLAGETGNTLTCSLEGVYTLVVTNEFGCEQSASHTYVYLGDTGYDYPQAVIYPNPSAGDVLIRFAAAADYQVRIFDESGRVVEDYRISGNSLVISAGILTPGVYMVQVSQEAEKTSFYRIVRQ